jgi:hypothetical protein
MGKKGRSNLLPKDTLTGIRLGISVSESPDLARLGLVETHFRLALAEIARCVLASGGQLAYGGHLESDGYTAFLIHELERYSRRDRHLQICLALSEHRKLTLSNLETEKRHLALYGEIVCLDLDGNIIDPAIGRHEASNIVDAETTRQSLTGLRHYMAQKTQGRVLIGGRRSDFQGDMPGLLEETLFAVEQGQPIFLAGGFGGITLDIAKALGIDDAGWLPVLPDTPPPEKRVTDGISRLIEIFKATRGQSLENGLTVNENRQLMACHRPGEIAALVSLGLGRKFSRPIGN